MMSYLRRTLEIAESLFLHIENETFIFPDVSNVFVTFTAGAVADTFGAWVEIQDNLAVTLSSVFAAQAGYLTELMLYQFSVANEIWIIEISYGAAYDVVARQRVRSDWTYNLDLLSERIPAGEAVYYRAMSETALATCRANFRYVYV